jgi:hypothetical protein
MHVKADGHPALSGYQSCGSRLLDAATAKLSLRA